MTITEFLEQRESDGQAVQLIMKNPATAVTVRGHGPTGLESNMQERTAPQCGCTTTGKIVRGMCVKHYDCWVHRTPQEDRPPAPRSVRNFWDHVDKSGNCWLWVGPTNRAGYGIWSERGFKGHLAHRYSLMQVGPCPPDKPLACHRCDVPGCVNPMHLYWGTAAENAHDYAARQGVYNKGVYKSQCPKGHLMEGENVRLIGRLQTRCCRICDNERAKLRSGTPTACPDCGKVMAKSNLTRHQSNRHG